MNSACEVWFENQQLEVSIPSYLETGIYFIKATSENQSKTFKISIL